MKTYLKKLFILTIGLVLPLTTVSASTNSNKDTGIFGVSIELLIKKDNSDDVNKENGRLPRIPIRIPTLLSIDQHTLYAYPANVGGMLMQITLTDEADNTVATYTAAGLDVIKFNLPTELSGNYDVEVRVNDATYVGHITLD